MKTVVCQQNSSQYLKGCIGEWRSQIGWLSHNCGAYFTSHVRSSWQILGRLSTSTNWIMSNRWAFKDSGDLCKDKQNNTVSYSLEICTLWKAQSILFSITKAKWSKIRNDAWEEQEDWSPRNLCETRMLDFFSLLGLFITNKFIINLYSML